MYLKRFPLLTPEEIENSPSRRDGVAASIEEQRRRNASLAIWATAEQWTMSAGTAAIASTFYLRYYTRKSLKKNQPFVISAAALLLAGKVNDEPVTYKALTAELFKQWYGGRKNASVAAMLYDTEWTEKMYAAVLDAEWCLIHALDFDFNVDLVHSEVAKIIKLPCFNELRGLQLFQQAIVSCCNDVMKKNGTLVLQYPVSELALAIIEFVGQRLHTQKGYPLPVLGTSGQPWYVDQSLSVEKCQAIVPRLRDMYTEAKKSAQKVGLEKGLPAVSGVTTIGGYSMGPALTPGMETGPSETNLQAGSPLHSTAEKPLVASNNVISAPTGGVVEGGVVSGGGKKRQLEDDEDKERSGDERGSPQKKARVDVDGHVAAPLNDGAPAEPAEDSEPEEGEIF